MTEDEKASLVKIIRAMDEKSRRFCGHLTDSQLAAKLEYQRSELRRCTHLRELALNDEMAALERLGLFEHEERRRTGKSFP